MHDRLRRALERRLEAIERRLARLSEQLTPEGQARQFARLSELYGAAAEDREPDLALTAEEAELLEKMRPFVPVYREILDEGIVTPDGQPNAAATGRDGGHE